MIAYNGQMQVPKRKPGKYTNERPDPNLTLEEFNNLKDKLTKLKLSLPTVADEVRRLAAMGDFSENAAYQMAKGRLRGMSQRILELEDQLKNAVIIKPVKDARSVQLGSKVMVEANGKEKTYLILGSAETNPQKGIISHNSPIGSALMGRKAGEKVKIQSTGVEYKIVKIE